MKNVSTGFLIGAIAVSLVVGAIVGFFLGVASTKAGARFLESLTNLEQPAQIEAPKKLVRERFELLYPENWTIDVEDEDYDPDQMFSIDSPGSAFVMFAMSDIETDPAESLQDQIDAFSNLMGTPAIEPFDTFGEITGKGAILTGRIFGNQVTVRIFTCYSKGMTVIIAQQYPDEDLKYIKDGLLLIEGSFKLKQTE